MFYRFKWKIPRKSAIVSFCVGVNKETFAFFSQKRKWSYAQLYTKSAVSVSQPFVFVR